MENTAQFTPTGNRRQDEFDPASINRASDAAKSVDVNLIVRDAYKKHGRGKVVQKALELGLGE